MEYRAFDICLTSLEGINPQTYSPFKSKFYSVVSLVTAKAISRQTCPVGESHGGGKIHSWNYPMRFYADESELQRNSIVLRIQLRRRRALCTDKDVGEVCVSLKDLYNYNKITPSQNDTVFYPCPSNNNFSIYRVVTASRKYKDYSLGFSFTFGRVFRAAVRRNSDDEPSATPHLQPAALRRSVSPSAPYIGTIYHNNYD